MAAPIPCTACGGTHAELEDVFACEGAKATAYLAQLNAAHAAERPVDNRFLARNRPTPPRFWVRTLAPGVARYLREPHHVVDSTTNTTVDRFKSKRAATMHARQLNSETKDTK